MGLIISDKVRTKLANKAPPVSIEEIRECFSTRESGFLEDEREQNRTIPPTWWFISDTFMGRRLKIVFVFLDDGNIVIKTAYDPNSEEVRIYQKYAI
jgi:hypothetical protein